MYRRRKNDGFTLIEAVVSIAIMSVAVVTFLSSMHSATMVSNEEITETDIQTKARKLLDALVKDMTNARITYLPNDPHPYLPNQPTATIPNIGPYITIVTDSTGAPHTIPSSDPDYATLWLLMKYQVPLVNKDPNNPIGTGSFNSNSYDSYSYNGFNLINGVPTPVSWGAYGSGDPNGVAGTTYDIVFKQTQIKDECQYNPSVSGSINVAPDPNIGSPYGIGPIHLDHQNNNSVSPSVFGTRFVLGRIQRRYNAAIYSSTYNPATNGVGSQIETEYPGEVVFTYDPGSKSLIWDAKYQSIVNSPTDPQCSMFYWVEWPGDSQYTGWIDGLYHTNIFSGNPPIPPLITVGQYPSIINTANLPPANPAPVGSLGDGWMDENRNGQWDPLLGIWIQFLDGQGDQVRMKSLRTRILLHNQSLGSFPHF